MAGRSGGGGDEAEIRRWEERRAAVEGVRAVEKVGVETHDDSVS